jgi:hypothetical protein
MNAVQDCWILCAPCLPTGRQVTASLNTWRERGEIDIFDLMRKA